MANNVLSLVCALLVLAIVRDSLGFPMLWIADEDGFGEWVDLTQKLDFSLIPAYDPSTSIHLYLYTNQNPNEPFELKAGDPSVGNFNRDNPTRVVIHGWHSSADRFTSIKNAYLQSGGYNVVMVDWSDRAKLPYAEAVIEVSTIGEYVASIIKGQLIGVGGDSYSNIQLTGHSLGAHISGVIGVSLDSQISRITGMDTALPLYNLVNNENKLDSTDALEVQAIHTCGGLLGYFDPVGSVDFYPNGGTKQQPGCGLDLTGSCSHSRSYLYFEESIKGGTFFGGKCSDINQMKDKNCNGATVLMGEHMPSGAKGIYYLGTNSDPPYAMG